MASQYRIERDRGTKEAAQQIEVLRERWPLVFPVKGEDARPLAISATDEIAAAIGWSRPYARRASPLENDGGLLPSHPRHDQRIALDGATAEPVGAEAKDMAATQLARLAARKAATKAATAAAPAAVKPPPPPARPIEAPPKTREQLRDQVPAGLLRRSA